MTRTPDSFDKAQEDKFKPDFENMVQETDYYLRTVSYIVKQRGREILNSFDITPPQFEALQVLVHRGDLTMGELCQHLYLASSTVTDLVDRMERNELVERERNPEDRRVIRIVVKEKGHRLIEEVLKAREGYLASIFAEVELAEQEHLLKTLKRLHEVMTHDTRDCKES